MRAPAAIAAITSLRSATEHKSVLDSFKSLEQEGCRVTALGVDSQGFIDLDELRAAITDARSSSRSWPPTTRSASLQPLAEIGAIASDRGVAPPHRCRAGGRQGSDRRRRRCGIDLLSLTAHKFYGPKGAGALYVRRRKPRLELQCQIDGGGHENGFRSGTLNVPGHRRPRPAAEIVPERDGRRVGAARGAARSAARRTSRRARRRARERTARATRLPHNLHVSFDDIEGEALLMALGDLAVSTGSACSSGSQAPSHVLQAIGAVGDRAGASIRFGLGRSTTDEDIDFAIERVIDRRPSAAARISGVRS